MNKTESEAIALATLKELLSPKQIATLTKYKQNYKNYFDFEAHNKKFRIYNRHLFAVREMDKKGKIVKSICSHRKIRRRVDGYDYFEDGSTLATVLNHYLEIMYDYKNYLKNSQHNDGDYGIAP